MKDRIKTVRISTTSGTKDIVCPFFVAHGRTEIQCEGVIPDCKMRLEFSDKDKKDWQQENYCEKNYQRCEIYCSIMHWNWEDE